MTDMVLWHRHKGPRNPEQARDVQHTFTQLDQLIEQLKQRTEHLEAVTPPSLKDQQGRREGE